MPDLLPQPDAPETGPAKPRSFWSGVARRFGRHRTGMFGAAILGFFFLVAFFAPLLAGPRPIACRHKGELFFPACVDVLHNVPGTASVYRMPKPFRLATFNPRKALKSEGGDWSVWPLIPFGPIETNLDVRLQGPSKTHWLGTDGVGRDVLARMIHGAAVSMKVGFVSMGIAACLGILIGSLAGYFGGWVDMLVSRVIEIVICFPTFFLILSILVWLPPSIYNVMIVIGVTGWTGIARYTRGEFMKLKTLDYTTAARALGAGGARIMFRHLLPNSLAPVLVVVTFGVAGAILTEAGLSWLGFGVQPPAPSWGNILRTAFDNLWTATYLILPPSVAIFLAVLSFNLVGDALRDVTDPRLLGSS